jgi:fumarylacetoacetate (FAA) hydrolase
MRFVTFLTPTSPKSGPRAGLHIGDLGKGRIVDLSATLSARQGVAPLTVQTLIEHWETLESELRDLQARAEKNDLPAGALFEESAVTLCSPLPRPPSMRDGYAFRQHVEAARRNRGVPMIPEFDHFPIFYFTNHLAVTGPGDITVQKQAQEQLDFELEAAVVIGKRGKNIPADRADEHIFGYCIMNDWSARKLQMDEMKLNLGPAKGKDFATSLGPYLVTRDELAPRAILSPKGERHDLKMRCFVNGKQVSFGNLKDMSWTFAQILERVSYGVEVSPGEVIGSGTVGTGCFLELNGSKITDNQWLVPGDEVVLEIESLGRLVNRIVDGGP